ncbi:MAG: efflux RND transporter permease subunit [Verrucomicrobiia bacterium]|jgi:HAE1 family hydrophobic/amphiphilic exporter-1
MNVAEPFIRRPIATSLVMLAILMFGVVAYRALPVSDLPTVDFPVILVTATLPGANPDTMASAVATPLEKQFSTIAGIESMNSVSALGSCQIILQFNLNRNIDAAAQDVQTAIAQAQPQLPQNLPSPPTYRKVNPADQPVLYLALSSPTLPLSDVDEYAETLMAQRISMVQDVAQVQVYGAQKYAVRVQLDPRALASRQIGIDEVVNAVDAANVNLPTGVLDGPKQSFTIQASGQLEKAKAYRPVIVAYRNGSPVRLQELGDVIDSVENNKIAAWYNRTRGVVLGIQKQPGSNTIRVIDRVKELLPRFRSQLPPSVELNVLYDRSISIRESVTDVKFTLVLTIGLVVLVIFLFLRNLSATLIPSLALPFSIVGTFAIMYPLGFSVDNLSLMALTLAVGFLVDDAIVMLENIVRHMEMGKNAWQASLDGSRQIGFTIISMTLSLAAVFLPVLFMSGVPGRLFREFSVTIGAAILVSGFVSLTLTPMLASKFLRPSKGAHHGKAYMVLERFFDGMLHLYETTLQSVLRHRRAMMVSWVASLVLMGWCFVKIPKGFLPSEDRGIVFMPTEAAEGISFSDMVEHQKAVRDVALDDPDVESAMSAAGGGPTSQGMNSGFMFILLKPRDQRRSSVDQYIERLRPRLAAIPGIQAYPQNPPPIQISATFTKAQYQFTLQGPDTKELFDRTTRMVAKLEALPELRDVTTDVQIKNPQVSVDINRDKASALRVTATQIEDALYAAYATRQVSTILTPNNQYRVIVELKPEYQADPSVLSMLYVRSSTGQLVPLDTVAKLTRDYGPLVINHFGQLPAATISFNLKPGVSIGDAVAAVDRVARETLPATISSQFQGTAQAFASSMGGMGVLLIMTVLVIYIILGILYESYIHPLTILSGLPSAGFGALVTLMVFRVDLSLYAIVGIIMLIGIVKKNAIMMIDFALEAERKENKSPAEAIYQGCLVRFRPIMMTTMAALVGTLPIALGYGAGGEARRPLGLAVVGGLLVSQLITLYLTPVVYTYMDAFQKTVGDLWHRRKLKAGALKWATGMIVVAAAFAAGLMYLK